MGTDRYKSAVVDDGLGQSIDDALAKLASDLAKNERVFWSLDANGDAVVTIMGRWGEAGDYDYGHVAFEVSCSANPACALREAVRLAAARHKEDYGSEA